MPRKEFPDGVIQAVLIKSRRHCCICDKWCGQRINIHHMDDPSDSSEDNAIPLCLDCHAEVRAYDPAHPVGRKYTVAELKELKQRTFLKYSGSDVQDAPAGKTEYGRGFHDGAEWAKAQDTTAAVWRLLSVHGDFALEVLYLFRADDSHTVMDDLLLSDDVETGLGILQSVGHLSAWRAGQVLGLWGMDIGGERLFLTKQGVIFRNMVRTAPDLAQRFAQLEKFWNSYKIGMRTSKPTMDFKADFPAGPMNALRLFVNCLGATSADPSALFVIKSVSPTSAVLSSVADGSQTAISASEIGAVRIDQTTGNVRIELRATVPPAP